VADKLYTPWVDATDTLSRKWMDAVQFFTDLWQPIADFFKDKVGFVTNKVTETVETAHQTIKNATGFDVKQTVSAGAQKVKSGYQKAVDYTRENIMAPVAQGAKWLGSKVKGSLAS
jgi:hypothetical protein